MCLLLHDVCMLNVPLVELLYPLGVFEGSVEVEYIALLQPQPYTSFYDRALSISCECLI